MLLMNLDVLGAGAGIAGSSKASAVNTRHTEESLFKLIDYPIEKAGTLKGTSILSTIRTNVLNLLLFILTDICDVIVSSYDNGNKNDMELMQRGARLRKVFTVGRGDLVLSPGNNVKEDTTSEVSNSTRQMNHIENVHTDDRENISRKRSLSDAQLNVNGSAGSTSAVTGEKDMRSDTSQVQTENAIVRAVRPKLAVKEDEDDNGSANDLVTDSESL